jgi:hypothetical protein
MKKTSTVPLPKARNNFDCLDDLAVGDSITFPISLYESVGPVCAYRQRRDGTKFTRRIEDGAVRIWRLA